MAKAKRKTHFLVKAEVVSKLTSKQIADMIDDCFWERCREGAGVSVVPAAEYEVILMHCEDFADRKAAVRREFQGEEERLVTEICRLRQANAEHRAEIQRLKAGESTS